MLLGAPRAPLRAHKKTPRRAPKRDRGAWVIGPQRAGPGRPQLRLPIIRRSTYQNISAIDANSCIAADTYRSSGYWWMMFDVS